MSEWTKQRLEQMIVDELEESLSLDYKRAESLDKTDNSRSEITKDVSAFANSSGGIIIYGIAEGATKTNQHLPERLDPIDRAKISREWLEQIIHSIKPKIIDLIVHPVTVSRADNTVCYIVEVPQSHTAHMARDHRYYKRHNFMAVPMEDYEVRDVMNRKKHPKIRVSMFVNRRCSTTTQEAMALVKVENFGDTMAKHVMVEVELPVFLGGYVSVEQPVLRNTSPEGCHYIFRLITNDLTGPLFPGSDHIFRKKLIRRGVLLNQDNTKVQSTKEIRISVYADEMPPIRAVLKSEDVLSGWTSFQS